MDNSRILDLFVGQLKSTLKCTHCGHCSVTFDPFWDLSLPIPTRTGQLRLSQCLDSFTREETLDGDEKPVMSPYVFSLYVTLVKTNLKYWKYINIQFSSLKKPPHLCLIWEIHLCIYIFLINILIKLLSKVRLIHYRLSVHYSSLESLT